MLYTEQDYLDVKKLLTKRRIIMWIPFVLLIVAGLVFFVTGQQTRSENFWIITTVLWLLAGFQFVFVFGVAIHPVKIYRKHLEYMLNGRMRETVGIFKSFDEQVHDKEGLLCHAMMLNIGEKDDQEDDRLFYFDDFLKKPEELIGKKVKVLSNDKMVSSIELI